MSGRPAARLLLASAVCLAAFLAFAVAGAATRGQAPETDPQKVTFDVRGSGGEPVGHIVLRSIPSRDAAQVDGQLRGLPPGFHSLRLRDQADCDERRFAGATTDDRGVDANALPPVLALEDGTATFSVRTDRLEVSRLVDGDGSAVVVESVDGRLGCGAVE